ncbi:MAG: M20/M25/M40 family metallo-hydrolase [Deltaproteobacteria bacterium]|nr:M20/M25/M40 family metallo-hydrolase [Candidatus Zymogenaceae bacterium]
MERINWIDVGDEAAEILSQYIQFDTTNPPGNEKEAVQFLANILDKEGIAHEIITSAPGRCSIRAKITGDDPQGVVLLSHADVVPADGTQWEIAPFAGIREDGWIWGRGSLDDKSEGVIGLMVMLLFARLGVRLKRDLVFLATADEETGGKFGAGFVAETHGDSIQARVLINEGGGPLSGVLSGGRLLYMIGVGEKGPLWLTLRCVGTSGHGSVPVKDNAVVRMSRALSRLGKKRRPARFFKQNIDTFTSLGRAMGGIGGLVLRSARIPFFRPLAALAAALKDKNLDAMIRDTISVTGFTSGIKANVIPDEAVATIDCRLLPGTDKEEFLSWLGRTIGDDGVEVSEILYAPPSLSPSDTDTYREIERLIQEMYPNAACVPMINTGFTDSRYFRSLGIDCYGLSTAPLTIEETARVHGKNERISERALLEGIKCLFHLVGGLCGSDTTQRA